MKKPRKHYTAVEKVAILRDVTSPRAGSRVRVCD